MRKNKDNPIHFPSDYEIYKDTCSECLRIYNEKNNSRSDK